MRCDSTRVSHLVLCSVLKMIREVEELGGSAEYARSLTDRSVPEVLDSSDWPSTPCSVRTFGTGPLFTCTITANSIYLGTKITALSPWPPVPATPDAKLLIKPGVNLEGQRCGWFVAPDVDGQKFRICFLAGAVGDIIAIVQGPGRDVQPFSGRSNLVTWV